ncbi:MAG TPA: cobalamin-binding protein [Chromatiales bacterium]|nr:cobalamin-binding protein [Chromatiales bacterium]HEX22419.1 cobalamin-binding protein [Chromatiales bacterium]
MCGALLMPAAQANVSVSDDTGREVRLAQPAQRIISLAPHITELLFSAGAGGRIVGVVEYSDYPPAAKKLPRVGSYNAVDMERILALRPDLVVAWASGNPPALIEQLRSLGLRVFLSEPRTLEDVASNLERLGQLAGTRTMAQVAADEFRRRLQALRTRYAGRKPVSVFYQIWHRPLMTVNGEHLISKVIRLCGGRNVFAELPTLVPKLDMEAVLAADPQAIVAGVREPGDDSWQQDWRRWSQLRAVREGHLISVPADLLQRHTLRILDGAKQLCKALDEVRATAAR